MENKNLKLNKTSLYDHHISLNAKMVNFASYLMPINYDKGIKYEYDSVRNDVGIFDVSHMGVFKVSGKKSESFLNKVLSNNVINLKNNHAMYTLLCNKNGGVIDDLILYKINNKFILIVNASNKEKDLDSLINYRKGEILIEDISNETSLVAIQGPNSRDKLEKIFNFDLQELMFYCCQQVSLNNSKIFIARTGYTGELGFEILGDTETINQMWDAMISSKICPSGLAVRDILRIEMGYCLYGHEINETINPIDSGLGWILDKNSNFIGCDQVYLEGIQKNKIIFIKMLERGIPRENYEILQNDKKIGFVTSGTFSYSLNIGVGIGFINKSINNYDNTMLNIRDKKYNIKIADRPFLMNTSLRE